MLFYAHNLYQILIRRKKEGVLLCLLIVKLYLCRSKIPVTNYKVV